MVLLSWHCCCDTAAVALFLWHCFFCDTAVVTLLLWHWCRGTTFMALLMWHCCCDTVSVTVLSWHYFYGTVADTSVEALLLRHCCCGTIVMQQNKTDTSAISNYFIKYSGWSNIVDFFCDDCFNFLCNSDFNIK